MIEEGDNTMDPDKTLVDEGDLKTLKIDKQLTQSKRKSFTSKNHKTCKATNLSVPFASNTKAELLKKDRTLNLTIISLKKTRNSLTQAIKVLKDIHKEKETETCIEKWRDVSIKEMNYILNMTLLKINKMGGYEEFVRKEVEAEKDGLRYNGGTEFEEQMEEYFDSEEFQNLEPDEQERIKKEGADQIEAINGKMEKELEKLDAKIDEATNKDFEMQNLCKKLQVDYHLVFEK
ncbi:hypothetical protein ACO0QE_002439 [Hanseniaspora vineae]